MSARSIRSIIVLATAAAALALPTAALAGDPSDSLSAVDSIAADVSVDGSNDSSAYTESEASDSPTTDVYGTTETIPPPVTDPCTDTSDLSDASGNECDPITTTVTETPETPEVGGGGGPEEPLVEEPIVSGGGEVPLPVVASEVIGGGAPELPFTGLPLWYAIYAGFGLMLLGAALWMRARVASRKG